MNFGRTIVGFLAAAAAAFPAPGGAQDAAAGEAAFRRICAVCHNPTPDGPAKLGPSLFRVVGRKAGTLDGYRFSAAKRDPDLFWTAERLDPYLANPREFMPGTSMAYAGLKNDAERANVIAYLRTLK